MTRASTWASPAKYAVCSSASLREEATLSRAIAYTSSAPAIAASTGVILRKPTDASVSTRNPFRSRRAASIARLMRRRVCSPGNRASQA